MPAPRRSSKISPATKADLDEHEDRDNERFDSVERKVEIVRSKLNLLLVLIVANGGINLWLAKGK